MRDASDPEVALDTRTDPGEQRQMDGRVAGDVEPVPQLGLGVRQASQLGRNCMQHQPYGDITADVAGKSEDCLYLNVWTQSTAGRRPVMVWIHGGGFFAGFGGEERHNGGPLARKGAVVVTINYRLGAFGFMAHPALAAETRGSSGNYGLLDQIAALQWVQRNIEHFGGDPSRVMIFGESAGAMSVGSSSVHRSRSVCSTGRFSRRHRHATPAVAQGCGSNGAQARGGVQARRAPTPRRRAPFAPCPRIRCSPPRCGSSRIPGPRYSSLP